MSPPTTRILLSAMPDSMASTVRTRCGACVVRYSVRLPVALLNEATQPQVSSGQGCTRGLRISSRTVTAAPSKAASAAALSPASQVKMWLGCVRGPWPTSFLSAMSSRMTGASVLHRLLRVDDGRQLLVVHLHQRGAVGGGVAVGGQHHRHLLHLEVHLLVGQHRLHVAAEVGIQCSFTGFRSSAVSTATTPGQASALLLSMPLMRACAYGLRTRAPNSMPGSLMSSM